MDDGMVVVIHVFEGKEYKCTYKEMFTSYFGK